MPNQTIEQLTTIASVNSDVDLLPVYETGVGLTRKITPTELLATVDSTVTSQGLAGGSYFDGLATGYLRYTTSTNALIGKSDFSFWVKFRMPELSFVDYNTTNTSHILFFAHSDASSTTALTSSQGNIEFKMNFGAGGVPDATQSGLLTLKFHDGTNQKESYYALSGESFGSKYAGKVVSLFVTKSTNGVGIYINGVLQSPTVTNHANGAVDVGNYGVGGSPLSKYTLTNNQTFVGSNGTDPFWRGVIYNFALYNRELSQSDCFYVTENGVHPSDVWAKIPIDVSGLGGVTGWDSVLGAGMTVTYTTGSPNQLVLTKNSSVAPYVARRVFNSSSGSIIVGKRYRASGQFLNNTGGTQRFGFGTGYSLDARGIIPGTMRGETALNGTSRVNINEFIAVTQNLYIFSCDSSGAIQAVTPSGNAQVRASTGAWTTSNENQFYLTRVGCVLNANLDDDGFSDLAVSLYTYSAVIDGAVGSSITGGSRNNTVVLSSGGTSADNPSARPMPLRYATNTFTSKGLDTIRNIVTSGTVTSSGSGLNQFSGSGGVFASSSFFAAPKHVETTNARNGMECSSSQSNLGLNYSRLLCSGTTSGSTLVPVLSVAQGSTANDQQTVLIGGTDNAAGQHNALGFVTGSSSAAVGANRGYIYFDGTNLRLVTSAGVRTITAT